MSIFKILQKPQPQPPPPIYKRQPLATATVVLAMIGMFVLGPIGYLWTGMAEELKAVKGQVNELQKEKVDNENLKDTLSELKEQRRETREAMKEQNTAIQKNQVAIEKLLIKQEMLPPGGFKLKSQPKSKEPVVNRSTGEVERVEIQEKKVLSPEQFEKFLGMNPEVQEKYKKYLEKRGYDVEGL